MSKPPHKKQKKKSSKMAVKAIYNPGEKRGFVYTFNRIGPEILVKDFPRTMVFELFDLLNFLNGREVKSGEKVGSGKIIAQALKVPIRRLRKVIHDKRTFISDPSKDVLLLWPLGLNAQGDGYEILDDWPFAASTSNTVGALASTTNAESAPLSSRMAAHN